MNEPQGKAGGTEMKIISEIKFKKTGDKEFTQSLPGGYKFPVSASKAEYAMRVVLFDEFEMKGTVVGQNGVYECEFRVEDKKLYGIKSNTVMFVPEGVTREMMPVPDPAQAW